MPVSKLYVEGDLEIQSLNPILLGNPVLQRGGSKNALKARAVSERRENRVAAGYLRDRDFDFDPPVDLTKPTLDSTFDGTAEPLGWRWCRHEIENYLIDPDVVAEAMNWNIGEYQDAIRSAASRIREYEIARWAIGIVRRSLPPNFELRTRPDGLNEIALPVSLASADVFAWAQSSIAKHRTPILLATEPAAIQQAMDTLGNKFDATFLSDVGSILVWFSGKDLLAALADWLLGKGISNPGAFRAHVRDWIIANTSRALQLVKEWDGLIQLVRA